MNLPCRRFSFLFLLLTVQFANSQITITTANIPVPGDRYVTASMDTAGVREGNGGANSTWNFSTLRAISDTTVIRYVTPSATPFAASFPAANLASMVESNGDSACSYMSADANGLNFLGSASAGFVSAYADPELLIKVPFTYNSTFNDSFYGTIDMGDGVVQNSRGTTTVTGDGFGTIILPHGSAPALRVRFVREVRDTVYFMGTPLLLMVSSTTSYEWFTSASKFPVLQIGYQTTVTNGNTIYAKLVELNANTTTGVVQRTRAGMPEALRLEQNFPNPFNPTTSIGFQLPNPGHVSLKVYNLLGQEVSALVDEQLPAGMYTVPFDAKGLASGTYIYRLQKGNSFQTRKLTLLK